jgi:hypothetical protein
MKYFKNFGLDPVRDKTKIDEISKILATQTLVDEAFKVVEGYLNNRQAKAVKAYKAAQLLMDPEGKIYKSLSVRDSTEKIVNNINLMIGDIEEQKEISEELLQELNIMKELVGKLYVDMIIAFSIVHARQKSKQGQKLVIAIETGQIPMLSDPTGFNSQTSALLAEIKRLEKTLRRLGLPNLEVVLADKVDLIGEINKVSTSNDKVIMLTDQAILNQEDFKTFKQNKSEKDVFIGLINGQELKKAYDKASVEDGKAKDIINVDIIAMLSVLMEASIGRDVTASAMVDNSYTGGGNNMIMFLPVVEVMNLNKLTAKHKGYLRALRSA